MASIETQLAPRNDDMMTRKPRLLAISVDGGTPSRAAESFAQYLGVCKVRALPSVFPNSTAPSHASFSTGTHPSKHGIVGNRFWELESVDQIAAIQAQPLAAVAPYSLDSLLVKSWALEASLLGYQVAAVNFPQTVAFRGNLRGSFPAVYCLYAPPRKLLLDYSGSVSNARIDLFGIKLEFQVDTFGLVRIVVCNGIDSTVIDERGIVTLDYDRYRLSVPVQYDSTRGDLFLGKSILETYDHPQSVMREVSQSVMREVSAYAPPLPTRTYSGTTTTFIEAPSVEWTENTALRAIERLNPSVLLVRFVQTDHAQEALYGDSVSSNPVARLQAMRRITETYDLVGASIERLISSWEGEHVIVFSDHGIDTVARYLRPNTVLKSLGLDGRLIFSGDSNCGYLYGCSQPGDLAVIDWALNESSDGAMRLARPSDLSAGLAIPQISPRTGCAQVISTQHTELVYEPGPASEIVRYASHGYDPRVPAMNGFVVAPRFAPKFRDITALGRWCRALIVGEKS